MIEFHSIDKEVPEIDPELFVLALSTLIAKENRLVGDVNIIVCSDEHLLSMNRSHLQHDYYTDIITFDYCEDEVVSGDLYISYDRVVENAELNMVDVFNEFARVCAHGVLHLCGYGDKLVGEAEIMRMKEDLYLPLFVSRET
jgi:probable rRNA maturation factor